MKKLLFLTLAILSGTISAQKINWELQVGAHTSLPASNSGENFFSKAGFQGGVNPSLRLTKVFAVSSGINFSKRKTSVKAFLGRETYSITYLSIPALAKIYATEKLAVYSGIELNFMISGYHEYEHDAGRRSLLEIDRVRSNYTGIPIGFNYDFDSGITLNTGYNLGLSSLTERPSDNTNYNLIFARLGFVINKD